jgi:hypothetical protein
MGRVRREILALSTELKSDNTSQRRGNTFLNDTTLMTLDSLEEDAFFAITMLTTGQLI